MNLTLSLPIHRQRLHAAWLALRAALRSPCLCELEAGCTR